MKRHVSRAAEEPRSERRRTAPAPMQAVADRSPASLRLAALQAKADAGLRARDARPLQRQAEEEEPLQGKAVQRQAEDEEPLQGKAVQRQAEEEEPLQGKALQRQAEEEEPLQGKAEPNRTGMPDGLKAGVEALSGLDMSDVEVRPNSAEPARVGALAFAQGNEIHLGPGQEQHLPHEAWHVAQQRQGRVRPTTAVAGVAVNDDPGLEHEADVMGARAQAGPTGEPVAGQRMAAPARDDAVQRYIRPTDSQDYRVSENRQLVTLLPQSLFATKPAIAAAARALEGARAMVTLAVDESRTPWEPFDGGARTETVHPVKLVWDSRVLPDDSVHNDLGKTNDASILHHSWADCHRTAQTVMGSSSKTGDNQEQPLVKQDGDMAPMAPVSTGTATASGLSDAQANRGIYALFEHAFPRFVEVLTTEGKAETHAGVIARINEVKAQKLDKNKMLKWFRLYRDVILKDEALADLFAKTFGINEYAVPEIGDALSQVGNEVERFEATRDAQRLAMKHFDDENMTTDEMRKSGRIPPDELKQLRDLWNFHWAGVIMKDGADYVTLENLSVENMNEINRKWYFKMYGPGKQSFHSETQASSEHSGDAPVTSGFRHVRDQ